MHLGARGAHPAAGLYQPVVLSLSGGAPARDHRCVSLGVCQQRVVVGSASAIPCGLARGSASKQAPVSDRRGVFGALIYLVVRRLAPTAASARPRAGDVLPGPLHFRRL